MRAFSSSLQVASVASALVWPLAVGVAVVIWSKVRTSGHARRAAAMEGELQSFYRSIASKPVPARLSMVVDALEEGEQLAAADAAAKPRRAAPASS